MKKYIRLSTIAFIILALLLSPFPVSAEAEQLNLPVPIQNSSAMAPPLNAQSTMRQWVLSGEFDRGSVTALEVFKGQIYAGFQDFTCNAPEWGMSVKGERISRSSNGTSWEYVSPEALGNPLPPEWSCLIDFTWDMAAFNGYLYAEYYQGWYNLITDEFIQLPGQLWRTADGLTWEAVTTDGLGDPNNTAFPHFAIFNDALYAVTMNSTAGFQVFRTSDGLNWQQVAKDGLGYPLSANPNGMTVFKGRLFIAHNDSDPNTWEDAPLKVWSTADGVNWTLMVSDGFGDANNVNPGDFGVYKGYLYLGLGRSDTGGAIYRSKDGQNWEPVMQGGFGSPENYKIEGMYTYEGQLYAHTLNNDTGIEIYRLVDSIGWVQVNEDGFGLAYPYNRTAKFSTGVADFKGDLYYGMVGDAETTQIWRLCYNCP
jgi:hypothetical protein